MRRAGFTLVEVLVSILIFSVVSVAMLTVFTLATRVFRDTEAARIAGDESIAVLAALDDDLKRMVPSVAGGWLFCGVHDVLNDGSTDDDGGNMVLAFLIADEGANNGFQLVAWWSDARGNLLRGSIPATSRTALAALQGVYSSASSQPVMGTGCLLFSADVATTTIPRKVDSPGTGFSWLRTDGTPLLPGADESDFVSTDTAATTGTPTALRISVVLTGGNPSPGSSTGAFVTAKESPVGFVIEDQGNVIRIGGLRTLPSYPGAMVRIGDPGKDAHVEWIAYTSFQNGRLQCPTPRAQRRTTQGVHQRNEAVRVGRTYTLVRELPR